MKGFTKRQREALIGFVLGDAYLQPTGKVSARLRLEHSIKQKEYIEWKHDLFENFMQGPPKLIKRFNPIWKRSYQYYRCQSSSSPLFGKSRRLFYEGGRKIIPKNIGTLLKSPFTLAVWYMDDGYYYHRDNVAYIYLSKFESGCLDCLLEALKKNFNLKPDLKLKKDKYHCLAFNREETTRLLEIVKPHIIQSLKYKIPMTL